MTESDGQITGPSPQQQDENWHYTRCPHCEVVFRVDRNKLNVRKGDVRCGACREVFHAPTNRVFRNHGGGFSALIANPLLQDQPIETVAEGSSISSDDKVMHNDPFSSEFTIPDNPVIESGSLFQENVSEDAKDETTNVINSRLFKEDEAAQNRNDAEADPAVTSTGEIGNTPVLIPKISSEPLLSRPRDDDDSLYRAPVLSSPPPAQSSDQVLVEPEISAKRPSFDVTPEEVERARKALLSPGEPQGGTTAVKLVIDDKKTTEWSNADVKPFGASAMPMPPSFEPFVPPQTESPIDEVPGSESDGWTSQDDSLLDHNPFARTEVIEEPPLEPANIVIEAKPRPAAINMSGVDEYIVDRPNPIAGFFWFLVSAAFVVLLGLQVKYFLVERFAQDETYRPYLQVFCGIARCELPPRKDAYRFTITQTRVDLHPREPGALRITVRLLNQAKFAQPYPELRLTLTDRVGRVVGRRKFDPESYLAKAGATRLAPGELGYVIFDLAHPHEKAVGFVVDVVRRSS